ncbi:MAG: ABC transporter ATP-binding protein [Candidatus Muiribacteriota bacterium]
MNVWRYLLKYASKYRYQYAFGILTLLIVDIAQLFIPLIISRVINQLERADMTSKDLYIHGFTIIGIAVLMSLMRFLWRYFIVLSAFRISRDMRDEIMEKFYSLPVSFFVKNKVGDLMANVVNDVDAVRYFTGIGLVALFDTVILTIMALGFMLYISPVLTAIALIPAPFIVAVMLYFEGPLLKRFNSIQELFGKMSEKVKESIEGIALIKLYRLFGMKKDEFKMLNNDYRRDNLVVTSIDALFHPVIEFLMMVTVAIIIYYGGITVIDGEINLGDFVAFTRYMDILIWPMIALGWIFSLYQRANSALKRIFAVLSQTNPIVSVENYTKEKIDGKICFDNVNFNYGDNNFKIKNVNVEIKNGMLAGITGKIGSGKTTLINLILRLYDVTEGAVLIDDIDIKKYNVEFLREHIAYVPQETFLFSESVLENLLFADPEADMTKIEEALKTADAWNFINELPEGINTVIGERGVSLSGGQRQRLSLARALLLERPLIILDDCLSAVDSETEKNILENLKKHWKKITTIVVSHRLSAFSTADTILVIDDGQIKEQGTHDELKNNSVIYKSIFQKQQLEKELLKS